MAAPVDVPGEVEAGAGSDLAEEGELGDLAVLELDVAEAVEGLLVGPVDEAEGVVELEGAWAPSSLSKAERVVADRAAGAGAKAAAEATRERRRRWSRPGPPPWRRRTRPGT